MNDEISAARRRKAATSKDVMPADAIAEAQDILACPNHSIDHAIVILRDRDENGNFSLILSNGGKADADTILGMLVRAQHFMINNGG